MHSTVYFTTKIHYSKQREQQESIRVEREIYGTFQDALSASSRYNTVNHEEAWPGLVDLSVRGNSYFVSVSREISREIVAKYASTFILRIISVRKFFGYFMCPFSFVVSSSLCTDYTQVRSKFTAMLWTKCPLTVYHHEFRWITIFGDLTLRIPLFSPCQCFLYCLLLRCSIRFRMLKRKHFWNGLQCNIVCSFQPWWSVVANNYYR